MGLEKGNKLSRLGPVQQKALLLILGGVGLSLVVTPKQYFRVIKEISNEWKNINKRTLERVIASLYKSKLIKERENPDGSLSMVLTEKGKNKIITSNIDNMEIKKPKKWDKKWRIVLFDIPDKHKKAREAIREILKKLGFYKYQESVFIHPHPCNDEIDFVTEYFDIRPYVRIITAETLDNELHLKKIFGVL
jgi:DNA-binding transcriptional regulator PaaX